MTLEQQIIAVLRTVYDPEIPLSIYDLGLVYELNVDASGRVRIVMTLTTPHCPVAEALPQTVKSKVSEVPGVSEVQVELTWDPPWTMEKLPETARLQLGLL
ncbi:MAG: SUF system Fe-S cluster assembly protein [Bryobacterales bacterium]|nr:SUF system Fe-S cluster assembly protein [Bryobacterales bacterium]